MLSVALTIGIASQVWAGGIAKKDISVSMGLTRVRSGSSAMAMNSFQKSKMIPKI